MESKIIFKDIYCIPVSHEHINMGWLSWMNNSLITKHLDGGNQQYSRQDLLKYLNEKKSKFFLACYSKNHIYFGNLRIYELTKGVVSFGRLIGHDDFIGKGFGKKLCDLANLLIFNQLKYETIVVGNKKENIQSAKSKIKSGFHLASEKELVSIGLKKHPNDDFYILKCLKV